MPPRLPAGARGPRFLSVMCRVRAPEVPPEVPPEAPDTLMEIILLVAVAPSAGAYGAPQGAHLGTTHTR